MSVGYGHRQLLSLGSQPVTRASASGGSREVDIVHGDACEPRLGALSVIHPCDRGWHNLSGARPGRCHGGRLVETWSAHAHGPLRHPHRGYQPPYLDHHAGIDLRDVRRVLDYRGARKACWPACSADQNAEAADHESPEWALGAVRAYLPHHRQNYGGEALRTVTVLSRW